MSPSGETIGRVAAFINDRRAQKFDLPTGGMGFFESIKNREVAFALFDAARNWLAGHGMQAMDGPINFGENDRNWGLLVDGFMQQGYGMPYNPPYYREYFEEYGFRLYFEQVSKHIDLTQPQPFPERFSKIYERIRSQGQIEIRYFDTRKAQQFGNDFLTIYNDAWQFHENFAPLTPDDIQQLIAQLSPVLIPQLAIFAYVKGEPAGFTLALPDLNQIFKSFGGKMTLLRGLLFLLRKRNSFEWYRKRGILTRARIIILGVRPKFQKMGVESAMIVEPLNDVKALGLKEVELGWVGDFNPKMRSLLDATGAQYAKTHHTYRYYFDPERREQFTRSTIIPMGTPIRNEAGNPGE
jgi:hypothetical protein